MDGRDQEGNTLLHTALNVGNPAIIKLALKGGGEGGGGVFVGGKQLGGDSVSSRTERGGDNTVVGEYLTAIRSGDIVKVKTLLCQGVCLEDRDSDGNVGLNLACETGQRDIADLLTQLGAEVYTSRVHGSIPLKQTVKQIQ